MQNRILSLLLIFLAATAISSLPLSAKYVPNTAGDTIIYQSDNTLSPLITDGGTLLRPGGDINYNHTYAPDTIPVSIYLQNPSADVTSARMSLAVVSEDSGDTLSPGLFIRDAEGELLIGNTSRWSPSHSTTAYFQPASGSSNRLYLSITSPDSSTFSGAQGILLTLYLNGRELDEGYYDVCLTNGILYAKNARDHTLTLYGTPSVNDMFTLRDGVITGITGSTAAFANDYSTLVSPDRKHIYDLNGFPVLSPQKGRIYIIGGRATVY